MVVGATVGVSTTTTASLIIVAVAVTFVTDRPVTTVHPVVKVTLDRVRVVLELLVTHEVLAMARGTMPVLPDIGTVHRQED